jgi:hypothetical protein
LTVTDNNTLTNSRVFSLMVVPGGVAGSVQNATWIRQGFATVSADGLTVQKTGGCTGCLDAGGISQQQISSGDGYIEFTRGADANFKQIGIDNPGVWASSVKYGFTLWPTYVEIRENGVYRGDTGSGVGDVLRIQIVGGQVKYFKNGVLIYTSTAAPAYPVALQVRLSNLNATFGNARILSATGGTAPAITSASLLPNATAGVFYTQALAATGGTQPYTWSVANGSSLPTGLTLTAGGVLSGTVAAAGGPFSFTLMVTDSNTLSNSRVFSLTVIGTPSITSSSTFPNATAGIFYTQTLAAAQTQLARAAAAVVVTVGMPARLRLRVSPAWAETEVSSRAEMRMNLRTRSLPCLMVGD